MAKAEQKPSRREIRRRTTASNLRKRRETAIGRLGEDGASSLAIEWKPRRRRAEAHQEEPAKLLQPPQHQFRIWMLTGFLLASKRMTDARRGLARRRASRLKPSRTSSSACQRASASLLIKVIRGMLPGTDNEAPSETA